MSAGVLDGIKVLDFGQYIAGPFAAMLLAEQGADVVKVERPGGDPMRSEDAFMVWNRSKKGITLDLTEAARDLLTDKGYDPTLGARPLRRAIQRYVEDPLSEKLLWKEVGIGQSILIDAEDGEIVFRQSESVVIPAVELAESGTESGTER